MFGVLRVEGDKFTISSPFLTTGAGCLIRREILERGKQERAKPSFQRMRLFQRPIFEEVKEKTLGEILRIVRTGSSAAREGI
jgi:hypothetical protein